MKLLQKLDLLLLKALKILASVFFGGMVILVVLEVLFRYFLKIPSAWAEELSRLFLVWCVVLSSAVGIRLHEHPHIELLTKHFPKRAQELLHILIYAIISVFGGVLLIYGIKHTYATRMDFMTSLGYHKNFFYLPSAVAGGLYLIYSLSEMFQTIARLLRKEEPA